MYPGTIYQNTGVFLGSKLVNNMCAMSNGSNQGQIDILFDANNGNTLYSGDKLQVSALQVLTSVNCPSNTINGPLKVTGLITGEGGMTVSGGSGASVSGNMTITGGDVKADEISLKNHRHTGDSGGDTGPAKV